MVPLKVLFRSEPEGSDLVRSGQNSMKDSVLSSTSMKVFLTTLGRFRLAKCQVSQVCRGHLQKIAKHQKVDTSKHQFIRQHVVWQALRKPFNCCLPLAKALYPKLTVGRHGLGCWTTALSQRPWGTLGQLHWAWFGAHPSRCPSVGEPVGVHPQWDHTSKHGIQRQVNQTNLNRSSNMFKLCPKAQAKSSSSSESDAASLREQWMLKQFGQLRCRTLLTLLNHLESFIDDRTGQLRNCSKNNVGSNRLFFL